MAPRVRTLIAAAWPGETPPKAVPLRCGGLLQLFADVFADPPLADRFGDFAAV